MRCRSGPHLRRHLAATLDLTLWCLGCDVRHPEGNLLLRRGFARVRPPVGRVGGTMYTGPAGGDAPPSDLVVWGFALFLGDAAGGAGLLLRRHDPAGARLTAAGPLAAPLWTLDALPAGRAPGAAAEASRVAAPCAPASPPAWGARQPRHVRRRQRLGTPELPAAWDAAADGYAARARGRAGAPPGAEPPALAAAA